MYFMTSQLSSRVLTQTLKIFIVINLSQIIIMSGWTITNTRNDTLTPQPDTSAANYGLFKFYLPKHDSIQIKAFQSKRIDSGWNNTTFPQGYQARTYTGHQIQKKGLIVIQQLFGLNGTQITAIVRNVTNKPVIIHGGSHFLSLLMNTLSHIGPKINQVMVNQNKQSHKQTIFSNKIMPKCYSFV